MLGAALVMLVPASGRAWPSGLRCWSRWPCWSSPSCWRSASSPAGAQYQFVESHHLDTVFRHRLHPRHRRHRTGAHRAHRGAGAAADRGRLERRRRPGRLAGPLHPHLPGTDPGRRGHGHHVAGLAGRAAVLRLLRGHAHPDVLPHRRIRRRTAVESGGEVPAVQPVRRVDHAGRGHRPVCGDRAERRLRRPAPSISARSSPRCPAASSRSTRRSSTRCSSASCSRSPSRRRCGRSTAGCPTPPSRPPRPARC